MRLGGAMLLGVALLGGTPAVAQEAAPNPQPLAPGRVESDSLGSSNARLVEFDIYYDLYSFSAAPGERVQIDMRSDAFDPYLVLGRLGPDGKFTTVAENDDADGLNARIVQAVPEGGDYLIRARGASGGATGAYTIELKRLGDAPAPQPPTPLTVGRPVEARFGEGDPVLVGEDGAASSRPYRLYQFGARAGQTYSVGLRSPEFDTYLEIGALTPLGFASARSNDDAEGDAGGDRGTDSRLTFRAERDGPVIVRASPLVDASTGAYTIEVR